VISVDDVGEVDDQRVYAFGGHAPEDRLAARLADVPEERGQHADDLRSRA
jgi:hypothetical protein